MNRNKYSPDVTVVSGTTLKPMPKVLPLNLISRPTIELRYPFANPTITLEIRNPSFNDKLTKKYSRIIRNTRGNDLVCFRDTDWPKADIINYAFVGLNKEKAEEALAFYKLSAGKYIGLTTYESILYKGIILNLNNPISQEGLLTECDDGTHLNHTGLFTLKLDFQGELVQ